MGVPLSKSEKSGHDTMPLLTAPSGTTPPLAKSRFVPGPAVGETSATEGTQGVNPGTFLSMQRYQVIRMSLTYQ
eukprot:1799848-Pyramimonas_sp.AAC.1